MKLRFTRTAAAELAEITEYIAVRNPRAASEFVARLRRLLDNIVLSPYMARTTNQRGTRVIAVGRYPYLVFYAVENDEISILHVRHGARMYPENSP